MPFLQADDRLAVPEHGGASSVRRKRHLTGDEIRRQSVMAQNPTAVAPVPRMVDRSQAYEPFDHAGAKVQWPRAVIRVMPGLARGEHVWAVKIWESPGVPARDVHGKLIAFSDHDRAEAFSEARERVEALRWSKLGRLRLKGKPQQEPPC